MLFRGQRSLLLRPILLIAVSAGCLGGQTQQKAKLPPAIETLFGMAMAAPPELGASALLRVQSKVSDKGLRAELVEMAFRLAQKAQNPYKLVLFPGTPVETRTGARAASLQYNLDALSLRARAVQDIMAIDRVRAREMFNEIVVPPLPSPACQDTLLPDVSAYYEALSAVVAGGFTDQERARMDHVAFGMTALARMSSMAEFGPAARMVAKLAWQPRQVEAAIASVTAKLEAFSPNSRAFLFYRDEIDKGVAWMVLRQQQLGVSSEGLARTYRKFLVTQYKGPQCVDAGVSKAGLVVTFRGAELFGPSIRGDVPPLSPDEMRPERIEGELESDPFWVTEDAKRISEQASRLWMTPQRTIVPEAQRRSSEWARQLSDVLNALPGWSSGAEASLADYFHQKAIIYQSLLSVAPPGDAASAVIDGFVGFLKGTVLEQDIVEWFGRARSVLRQVRLTQPAVAARLMAAYRESGSIPLVLEAMVESIVPTDPFDPANFVSEKPPSP